MKPTYTVNVPHLQEYVQAISSLPKFSPEMKPGPFPFITISRQTGTGGHTLAETIVKEMEKQDHCALYQGWQILDQDLCKQVVDDPKLKVSMESLLTEKFRRGMDDSLAQIIIGTSPQIAVFHKIAKLIRTFAAVGKVVIVGRAGSLITQDIPSGIHVRLVASKHSRVLTMMRQFNLSKTEAEAQVQDQDNSRALLVRTYFNGRNINDPLLYDITLNTDTVPIPKIADVLLQWVKDKDQSLRTARVESREKLQVR